jgi:inhibitor of the pro-sigma K processing machinery
MVQIMWWGIFLVSVSMLVLLVLRSRSAAAWLATMGIHVVTAAALLYFINWLGQSLDFRIPINAPTIAAIGTLGVPGLALLVALKVTLIR